MRQWFSNLSNKMGLKGGIAILGVIALLVWRFWPFKRKRLPLPLSSAEAKAAYDNKCCQILSEVEAAIRDEARQSTCHVSQARARQIVDKQFVSYVHQISKGAILENAVAAEVIGNITFGTEERLERVTAQDMRKRLLRIIDVCYEIAQDPRRQQEVQEPLSFGTQQASQIPRVTLRSDSSFIFPGTTASFSEFLKNISDIEPGSVPGYHVQYGQHAPSQRGGNTNMGVAVATPAPSSGMTRGRRPSGNPSGYQ